MTENDRPRSNNYGPLAILDRTLGRLVAAASILVLPVSLLLFLQWPLREWLLAYLNDPARLHPSSSRKWHFAAEPAVAATVAPKATVAATVAPKALAA